MSDICVKRYPLRCFRPGAAVSNKYDDGGDDFDDDEWRDTERQTEGNFCIVWWQGKWENYARR